MAIPDVDIGRNWLPMPALKSVLCLLVLGATGLGVQGVSAQPDRSSPWPQKDGTVAVSLPTPPLPNGVYLYSNAQQPEQAQSEYFVFRVTEQKVVGAFYMPQSSFDCFRGQLNANQLDLKIVTSYEQQVYGHTLSLNAYHPMKNVSANDHRMLEACQSDASLTALGF